MNNVSTLPCETWNLIALVRERVYLPQNKEQTYKNILNISAVAGYQKGKPIKLVVYETTELSDEIIPTFIPP